MITNAYRLLCSLRNNGTVGNTFPVKTIKDYTGTSYNTTNSGSTNTAVYFSGGVYQRVNIGEETGSGYIGIYIGTGDTAPTPDDYTLESPLTSSSVSRTSTSANASAILDENNNVIGVRRMVTYQNITSDNIVVKEIGTFFNCSYSSSTTKLFLIERTVLDEPVTLEPNGTITVAFDVTY